MLCLNLKIFNLLTTKILNFEYKKSIQRLSPLILFILIYYPTRHIQTIIFYFQRIYGGRKGSQHEGGWILQASHTESGERELQKQVTNAQDNYENEKIARVLGAVTFEDSILGRRSG